LEESACKEFKCPSFVPAEAPDDFCIPEECCPERFPTNKYPSPSSCLPEEQLEALIKKIKEANRLLLDLSLSNAFEDDEMMEDALNGFIGMRVNLDLDCTLQNFDESVQVEGKVHLVGRNFVVLHDEDKERIVPYHVIKKIQLKSCYSYEEDDRNLCDIDPCLRRAITFHFGETVSASPELINTFYGLFLDIYLLLLIDEKVNVLLNNEDMSGSLYDVHKESLTLDLRDRKREIPFGNICYIELQKASTN
jgi:ribosome maturation factor RimP